MRKLWLIWLAVSALAWAQTPTAGTDVVHTVAPGEDLYKVSHSYGLGLDHVAFANKLPMKLALTAGQELTIPLRRVLPKNPPRNGMVLNIPERGIFFYKNGRFDKFYPVAVGRLGFLTPRGSFKVIEKQKDPTWVPPAWANLGGKSIGPGKDNPLGDRWIGLSATRVGIHGTQSPYSIGDAISHGCLRMYPEMVRELYDRVSVGMPIRIEYETAKLGRDPATGELVLATFPDVYHLSDPVARAKQILSKAGVKANLAQVATARGLSLNLQGQPAVVAAAAPPVPAPDAIQVRQGERIVSLPTPPIEENGQLWVPAELLTDLGMRVFTDPGADWGAVTRDGQRLEYRLGDNARQVGDRLYFLAPALLDGFGMSYRWERPTLQLAP